MHEWVVLMDSSVTVHRYWEMFVAVLACGPLVSVTGMASEGEVVEVAKPFLYDDSLRLFWPREQACGLLASYIVLNAMSRPTDMTAISHGLAVSEEGTSMLEIADFISSKNLYVNAVSLSASGLEAALMKQGVCAIAWVDENHWVAVVSDSSGAKWFDYPAWHDINDVDFPKRFSGRALLISESNVDTVLQRNYVERFVGVALSCMSCSLLLYLFWARVPGLS